MEEDITSQFGKALPPEVYVKCLNNFHLQGEEIASRYDKLINHLKDDNYVEVDKSSTKAALSILKGTSKAPNRGAHKVTFDSMNYYQYDSRPANQGQDGGNRQWNCWNNNGNRNKNDQTPQGNRDNNSNQNQGNNGEQRDNAQGRPNRQTIVCTYPCCDLKEHKEDDCRCKADDLQNAAFMDSIIESVQDVVSKSIGNHLKGLGFTRPET